MAVSVGPYLERVDVFDKVLGYNLNRVVDLLNNITDYSGRVSPGMYHAEVYRNAAQSVANGFAFSDVVYDTTIKDPNSSFNTSTGTYTCPLDGRYMVNAKVVFTSGTGTAALSVSKNGATDTFRLGEGYSGSSNPGAQGMIIVNCIAGDTLKIQAAQNTATNPAPLFVGSGLCYAQFTYMGLSA